MKPDLPVVEVLSRAEWREWLAANHLVSKGVWVATVKKASLGPDDEYVGPTELGEECLCFGWIDSKIARIDDRWVALLCTPRKAGSGWSRVNKERVERLELAGLMTPAGRALIDAAKADGSWTMLDDVENLVVPEDLRDAFAQRPGSRDRWDGFPRSTRRATLEWIVQAKRPETRARRIEQTAELCERGERPR